MPYTLHETSSDDSFVTTAVDLLATSLTQSITDHGSAFLGLSGGSSPRPVYEELGKRTDIDWSKVTIFLIDERYIAADHDDSNQKLVRDSLLANASIPEEQCLFPDTSLPIESCIEKYGEQLAVSNWQLATLVLGMGPDGHIASLFPPVAADLLETDRITAHTTTDEFAVHDRITVTMPPMTKAAHALFLLKGEGKKAVWEEMLASSEDTSRWPAKGVTENVETDVVTKW